MYGGINYIEISAYPQASVSQMAVPDDVWWELERQLVLVFLGRAHGRPRCTSRSSRP